MAGGSLWLSLPDVRLVPSGGSPDEGPAGESLMRILLVSHRFPPSSRAGTEVYTEELGARLAALGHAVHVFSAEKDVGATDLTLRRREQRGLEVHELVQNLYQDEFRQTWRDPRIDARFEEVLEQVQPDLVHLHHLLYLSCGLVERAKARGLPVVMTLHDFWLECPRFGQLVHADGSLCTTVDAERCGSCLCSFPWRQSGLARGVGRGLARVGSLTGIDLAPVAKGWARGVTRGLTRSGRRKRGGDQTKHQDSDSAEARLYREQVLERRRDLLAVCAKIDHFIAPSRFLARRLEAWGLPGERMEVLASGVDRETFGAATQQRPGTGELRVAFLGTQVQLKGAHVLLDAWERLDRDLRRSARLTIEGPDTFEPDYVRELRRRGAALGVEVGGALDREGVARRLASTDLLVVPSLWFENRPLILLEALAGRTALCVSDLGGLVELVEEGDAGWRFPPGDAEALASILTRVIRRPGLARSLPFAHADELLPSWERVAARHLACYRNLLGEGAL